MEETKTLTMVKGLTMFNWPYPTTLAINDSTLGSVGTGGAGAATADVTWEWQGDTQTYKTAFLIDGWGAPYDGNWWDETTGDYSDIELGPGKAFWYQRRPDNSAVWICQRPY
jgi:transcription elongation factor